MSGRFLDKMIEGAGYFRTILSEREVGFASKDELAVRWVTLIEECIDIVRRTRGDALQHATWGPSKDITTFQATWKDGARFLAHYGKGLSADARGILRAFADQPYMTVEIFGCTVTHDWFSAHTNNWSVDLERMAGKPGLEFLEIGSFEGLSACWTMQQILTAGNARITCIDLFDNALFPFDVECTFDNNIRRCAGTTAVRKLKGRSQDVLRSLRGEAFDFIYVDASHDENDVYRDAALSWTVLKHDGLIIFDDYLAKDCFMSMYLNFERPDRGIDAFLREHPGDFRLVRSGYQLAVQKL